MPWTNIPDSDVDAESPLTESLAKRWRDNPEQVAAGDASVPYGKKILVPNALKTTNTTITDVCTPDGAGGVQWTSRSVVASAALSNGQGAYTQNTPGTYDLAAIPVDTLYDYIVHASLDFHTTSGGTPLNLTNYGITILVSAGLVVAWKQPFPLDDPGMCSIDIVISGGYLRLQVVLTSGTYSGDFAALIGVRV